MKTPRWFRARVSLAILSVTALISTAAADPPAFILKWGSRGSGPGQFERPFGIAVDPSHDVYVSDQELNRIQKFTSQGVFITQWGSTGSGPGQFNGPQGLATDAAGNVYVADSGNNRIQLFTGTGAFLTELGPGLFSYPQDVGLDAAGNVFVLDNGHALIKKFTAFGTFVSQWGCFSIFNDPGCFNLPEYMGVAANGTQYASDWGRLIRFTGSGASLSDWDSDDVPMDVAVDASGIVHVVLNFDMTVRRYASTGVLIDQIGTSGGGEGDGQFVRPMAVAVDGNFVYVTEGSLNQFVPRVQKFGPGGATPVVRSTWGRLKAFYR